MPDYSAAKNSLESRLAELEARQKHLALDLAQPLHPDSSERAIEMEDDAALEGQADLVTRESCVCGACVAQN